MLESFAQIVFAQEIQLGVVRDPKAAAFKAFHNVPSFLSCNKQTGKGALITDSLVAEAGHV